MDEWEARLPRPWSSGDWEGFFQTGGAACCVCEQVVDDPRFACALEVHRSWEMASVSVSWAHIECLRKAIPHIG